MSEPIVIYKVIYKTYTQAVARAQQKYRKTEKGKQARLRASKKQYEKNRDKIKTPVKCSFCDKLYSGYYIKKHMKTQHYTT